MAFAHLLGLFLQTWPVGGCIRMTLSWERGTLWTVYGCLRCAPHSWEEVGLRLERNHCVGSALHSGVGADCDSEIIEGTCLAKEQNNCL